MGIVMKNANELDNLNLSDNLSDLIPEPKEDEPVNQGKTFTLTESQGERFLGVVVMVAGLLLRFVLIPTQIKERVGYPTPRTLPTFYAYGLIILAACIYYVGAKGRGRPNQKTIVFSALEFKLVGFTMTMLAIYTLLLPTLRYIPATVLTIAVMMLYFGHKNKITIVCTSIAIPVAIYLFFTNVLRMVMP